MGFFKLRAQGIIYKILNFFSFFFGRIQNVADQCLPYIGLFWPLRPPRINQKEVDRRFWQMEQDLPTEGIYGCQVVVVTDCTAMSYDDTAGHRYAILYVGKK